MEYAERWALGPDGYEFYRKESGETGIMKNDSVVFEDHDGNPVTYVRHPDAEMGLYVVHTSPEGKEPQMNLYTPDGKLMDVVPGTELRPYPVKGYGVKDRFYFSRHVKYDDGFSLYDYDQKKYTKAFYDSFGFETNESGHLTYVVGNINGMEDYYRPDLKRALPDRYKTMTIKELPGSGKKVRYMENEFGYKGYRTMDMKELMPEVWYDIYPTEWFGDEDGDIYWMVQTHDGRSGLYKYNGRPVISVEHGIDWLTLEYNRQEDYRWIMTEDKYADGNRYSAVNRYGRQQTKEYGTRLFYTEGNFYYLTHEASDEGYLCETPLWSAEFYSVQNGLTMKAYVYDDGLRLHGERNEKFRRKGRENGYEVYEGERPSNNMGGSSMTYYVNKNGIISRQTMSMTLWSGMPIFKDQDTYYTRTPMSLTEYRMRDFTEHYGDSFIEETRREVRKMSKERADSRRQDQEDRMLALYAPATKDGEHEYPALAPPPAPLPAPQPPAPLPLPHKDLDLKKRNYEIELRTAEQNCENWYNAALSVSNGESMYDRNGNRDGILGGTGGMSSTQMRATSTAKMKFNNAKQELIKLRNSARNDGIELPPSRWENTDVY